jgi:hypothetical protein
VAQPFRAASAQQNPNAPRNFTKITAPVIALTHARVIDGTGAPARADPTVVLRDARSPQSGARLRSRFPTRDDRRSHRPHGDPRSAQSTPSSSAASATTPAKLIESVQGQVGIW